MKIHHSGIAAFVSIATLVISTWPVFAQPGARRRMPRYDPATEVTITGTVIEVISHQMSERRGPGRDAPAAPGRGGRGGMQGMTGIHLMVEAGDEVIEVHVGPSSFIESEAFAFAAGDELEVVGSRITSEGTDAIVARRIAKGDDVLTVRDEQGRPRWSRQRRSR